MRTVVHIGFHKTGSTALQRRFFPELPGVMYLTHGGRTGSSVFRLLTQNLMDAPDDEYLRETVAAYLSERRPQDDRTLLISLESLSGSIFKGAYNRERNAVRLHDVLPDAHILMVVRNQRSMIPSAYAQHVRRGGYSNFSKFLGNEAPDCDFNLDHLRYDTLVRYYWELFGRDRVLVLPYEDLVMEPTAFLHTVARYIRPDHDRAEYPISLDTVGRSLSPASRLVTRYVNRSFVKSSINPRPLLWPVRRAHDLPAFLQHAVDPALFRSAGSGLSARDEALLESALPRYEQSNAALQQMTGLALDALDYPMPGSNGHAARDVSDAVVASSAARSATPPRSPWRASAPRDADTVVYVGLTNPLSPSIVGRLFHAFPSCRVLTGTGAVDPMYLHVRRSLLSDDDDAFIERTSRAWLRETTDQHERLLIADERLSGDVFDGCRQRVRTARRLARLLPHARVLVVIRRQDQMLRWLYDHYVAKGGTAPFAALLSNDAPGCNVDIECFQYDEPIELYQNAFGRDRVTVVPFETYEEDQDAFVAAIADCVGTAPQLHAHDLVCNGPRSVAARTVLRGMNRVFGDPVLSPAAPFTSSAAIAKVRNLTVRADRLLAGRSNECLGRVDEHLVHEAMPRYAAGNRRVIELTGIDLKRYGYPCG